jgi:hypothetical protein
MKSIVIVHFLPIELYPPVQNLLNELQKKSGVQILVFTTNPIEKLSLIQLDKKKVKIIRMGVIGKQVKPWKRYLSYLYFNFYTTISMIWKRPNKVLYFETLSAYPVFLYKTIFNKRSDIFIHYHEYVSIPDYNNGMFLAKYFHKLEKKLYSKAAWVSQTNDYRMKLFKGDIASTQIPNSYILPNYPPKSWYNEPRKKNHFPLTIVYAGALGLETMFIKEFSEWVMRQNGQVVWDIYSYNYNEDVINYIKSLNSNVINLKTGVDYADLPPILNLYDIGVILYKGHIPNYIYNAPNKLFEYLACGLDVWLPDLMKGSLEYVKTTELQKVIPLTFTKLDSFKVKEVLYKSGHSFSKSEFFCEIVLEPLINKLLK